MIRPQASEIAAQRPYAFVGAGGLTASIWKSASASAESHYAFNIFRLIPESGQVSQRFGPADVADLMKLAHVLAATLLDDGCLSDVDRRELRKLIAKLETLWPEEEAAPGQIQ